MINVNFISENNIDFYMRFGVDHDHSEYYLCHHRPDDYISLNLFRFNSSVPRLRVGYSTGLTAIGSDQYHVLAGRFMCDKNKRLAALLSGVTVY